MKSDDASAAANPPPNDKAKFDPRVFGIYLLMTGMVVLVTCLVANALVHSETRRLTDYDTTSLTRAREICADNVAMPITRLEGMLRDQSMLDSLDGSTTGRLYIEEEFVKLLYRNPQYAQMSWLDQRGFEIVRVDQTGNAVTAMPESRLADKSTRDFFKHALGLPPGDFYLSLFSLNGTTNSMDPYNSSLRLTYKLPVRPDDDPGYFMLTLRAESFVSELSRLIPSEYDEQFWLADSAGRGIRILPYHQASESRRIPFLPFSRKVGVELLSIATTPTGEAGTTNGLWFWSTFNPIIEPGDHLHSTERIKLAVLVPSSSLARLKQEIWVPLSMIGLLMFLLLSLVLNLYQRLLNRHYDLKTRLAGQAALKKSQAALLEAQRLASIGSWEWDDRNRQSIWSGEVFHIFGYDPDRPAVPYPEYSDRFTKETWPGLDAAKKKALVDGTPYVCDAEVVRPDGSHRWITCRGEAIRSADGTITGLRGTVQDITDRKQAETTLQAREEIFSSIVGQAVDAIALLDFETGAFIEFSTSAHESLGYTREEFARMSVKDIQAEHSPEVIRQNNELARKQGGMVFETRHRHRDGSIRDVRVSIRPLRLQSRECLAAIWSDITARKEAVDALRRSEERLTFALQASGIGAWSMNLTNHTSTRTDIHAQIFGQASAAEPWNLEKFLAHVLPEDRDQVRKSVRDGIATRSNWSLECRIRRADGQVRWISVAGGKEQMNGTSQPCISGIVQDITERKQAEQALLQSEAEFRGMFEVASLGMVQADPVSRRALRVNRKLCEITGCPEEELLRMNIKDLLHPDDRKQEQELFCAVISGEKPAYHMECRCFRKDGSLAWVSLNLTIVRDVAGRPLRIMTTVEDITQRKRAEAEIKRLATVVEQAAEAIFIADLKGNITYANPAFEKITGYGRAEVLGKNPRFLKSGKQDDEFYRNFWATIQKGETWTGHFINRRKNGTTYVEEAIVTPIRDHDGKVINYVAVKQDITRERDLENQLRQTQKMEAIGTLAGGIAHDFNNILSPIMSYANMLQLDLAENPDSRVMADQILQSATRAKELVRQILMFSRRHEQKREIIRITPIVKEAAKLLQASKPVNVQVELVLAPRTPPVLADPTQIYQVIMNLATNAMHAMENKPGKLTIRLDSFTPDPDTLAADPNLKPIEYTSLAVTDTGHGMDEATLKRIFEPFYTTKGVGKGTGLGLAVVHGIVQSHEGIIKVESQPGQGTTFLLYFPAQKLEATAATNSAEPPPLGKGQSILVVDDEANLRRAYEQLLTKLKYRPKVCTSSVEALDLFKADPTEFDLVLTDLAMPGMTGLELTEQILAIRPEIPVVMMSGYITAEVREEIKQANISDIINKPAAVDEVARVLCRNLPL